jgi:hypothetical protein
MAPWNSDEIGHLKLGRLQNTPEQEWAEQERLRRQGRYAKDDVGGAIGGLLLFALAILFLVPGRAQAQFGGSTIVFDPSMFARQLQQLQQETATVQNLANQLICRSKDFILQDS